MELQTWHDHHRLITRTRIGNGIFTLHHLCNTLSAYSVHSFAQYEANCVPMSLCQWLDATALYCYTFMPNISHTILLFIATCSQSADYMQKCLYVTTVCCLHTSLSTHSSKTEQLVKFDIGLFFHSLQKYDIEASMLKWASHRADDNTGSFLVLQWNEWNTESKNSVLYLNNFYVASFIPRPSPLRRHTVCTCA